MTQSIVKIFSELGYWAILASLFINGVINMIGFVPSIFVTTANILMWGPWLGGALSWLSEVIGSVAAFWFYRKGIQVAKVQRHMGWNWIQSLNQLSPFRQFLSLIAVRITPFIPSGVINLVGALTTVSFFTFLFSTVIGKVPSIALEAWISYGFLHIKKYYIQLIFTFLSLGLGYVILKKQGTSHTQ